MHGCDEANTTGESAITRQTGVYGGGSRYGYLSTPKSSPSAGRMKHTQGTYTVAINVAQQLYG